MKTGILVIGLFLISVLRCTEEEFDNSLNGSWTVFSFENLVTGTTEFRNQENSWGKEIRVTFDDTVDPKTISGINTTNQIFGEFTLVGNSRFAVSNLGSTYANQPRWSDQFLKAILDPNLTFRISKDRLIISYDNRTKRVTLMRN